MKIGISSHVRGTVHYMTVSLTGDEKDFINLIDEGSEVDGTIGVLIAKIAASTSLVAARSDANADAARLLRRAAELLDRPSDATGPCQG